MNKTLMERYSSVLLKVNKAEAIEKLGRLEQEIRKVCTAMGLPKEGTRENEIAYAYIDELLSDMRDGLQDMEYDKNKYSIEFRYPREALMDALAEDTEIISFDEDFSLFWGRN
jgi:hypothetical protein